MAAAKSARPKVLEAEARGPPHRVDGRGDS